MENQTFTETFRLAQADCDLANRAMPAALLRKAQQLAIDHCNAIGLTDDVYLRTGTAFLMAKVALEIYRPIRLGEQLRATTMPSQSKRAVYNRLTTFEDEQGQLAALYDSRWVLVDVNSRRILRQPPEGLPIAFDQTVDKELDFGVERLPVSQGRPILAGYSLCDCNRHINNTRYADLVCDAIDPAAMAESRVKRIVLVYHNEVPFGQEFTLAAAQGEGGYWYVQGTQEAKRCLEAAVWLETDRD